MRLLSRILFALSLVTFLSFIFLVWLRLTPRNLAFDLQDSSIETQEIQRKGYLRPTGIVIEKIGVWLPVYPASITNGAWETSYKGVSFLKNSGIIGKEGNAIFYGHNWPNLLGKLPNIAPGDTIRIVLEDNSETVFVVTTTQEVDPKDTSVLASSETPRITIYTCTGFLDSKRFVVVATQLI